MSMNLGTGTSDSSASQINDSHHKIFDFDSASLMSHAVEVYDVAWLVYAYDLPPGVTIQIQHVYGNGPGDTFTDFTPLPSAPMYFDENVTAIPLAFEGRYRFVLSDPSALGTVRVIAHRTTLPHQEYTHFYTDIQRIRYDLSLDQRIAALESAVGTLTYSPLTGELTYDDEDANTTTMDISAPNLLAIDPGVGPANGLTDVQAQLDALNAAGNIDDVVTYDAVTGTLTYTDSVGGVNVIDISADQLSVTDPTTGPGNGSTDVETFLNALNTEAVNAGTLSGVGVAAVDYGAMPGTVLPDNADAVTLFQAIDTALTGTPAGETPISVTGSPASGISLTLSGTNNHDLTLGVTLTTLCTALLADPTCRTAIIDAVWTGIVGNKISWDGTELCIDYNDNGNVNA